MPIRMARLEDIPALVEGGRRMHALTRFRHFDYLPEKVARNFEAIITRGQGKYIFMVAERADGEVVGALLAVLENHIFSDQIVASVMHFDVLPEARGGGYAVKLLLSLEKWAAVTGAMEICVGQNSAGSLMEATRFRRFVSRAGYSGCGGNFHKRTEA